MRIPRTFKNLPIQRTSRVGPLVITTACLAMTVGLSACSSSTSGTPRFSGPVYEVGTSQLSGLGNALIDGKGFTLYLYEPDAQSGHSRCSGPCAVEWVPLTVAKGQTPIAGPGARGSLLSTTHRSDGTTQVTYNGWPLYTWTEDMAPGQATGEGLDNLGGLWFVVNAAGNAVKKIGSGST
jgi:predicted lipoprotein with Yx(FWY)xxD motif